MARLTRMQKYAERRKEMANENEANQNNSALDAYKNKLDALEANFNELKKEEVKQEVNEEINIEPIISTEPRQEDKTLVEEVKNTVEATEEKDENDFLASLDIDNIDKAINDIFNQKISTLDEQKDIVKEVKEAIKETSTEVKPQEEKVEEVKPLDIEDTLKSLEDAINEAVVKAEPKQEEKVEAVTPVKEEVINVVDENYEDIANKLSEEVKELNGEVEPVKEEEKVLPKQEPVQEEIEEPVKVEPVITRPAPVKEKEVVNIIDEDYATIASKLANVVEELDGKVEPIKEEEKVLPKVEVKQEAEPVQEETVESIETTPSEEVTKVETKEEIKEEPVEVIEEKAQEERPEEVNEPTSVEEEINIEPVEETISEVSVDDILGEVPEVNEKSSTYVDEALKEAQEYNKQDGRKTADDVKDMIVDDIRHNKPEEMDSEEFANTVSLEIDKVLSEINTEIPSINVADVTLDDVVAPIEIDSNKVADKLADTIEHPVLAKAASEEGVVEIKSMEETLTTDVVDDTIPFMMDDVKEDKVEYEEIDDEKPNKVLNIILIVLIVILLVILGVIGYYLLYAKGIIG